MEPQPVCDGPFFVHLVHTEAPPTPGPPGRQQGATASPASASPPAPPTSLPREEVEEAALEAWLEGVVTFVRGQGGTCSLFLLGRGCPRPHDVPGRLSSVLAGFPGVLRVERQFCGGVNPDEQGWRQIVHLVQNEPPHERPSGGRPLAADVQTRPHFTQTHPLLRRHAHSYAHTPILTQARPFCTQTGTRWSRSSNRTGARGG